MIIDIKNYKTKDDAIFFCSRRVFITGVEFMHKYKIIIPDEMDVLSFDKIDSFSIANIPFYFIEQPIKEMGEKAVDVLIQQIQGETESKKYILNAEIKVVE